MLNTQARSARYTALTVAASLLAPVLAGCGGRGQQQSGANLPPIDDSRGTSASYQQPAGGMGGQQTERRGMSTKQKVVLLAGAAALYYMYKKHRDANNQPAERQYYLSKNGRVYYRDENKQAHWVTPPPQGIEVPQDEVQSLYRGERDIRELRGYNGRGSGEDFGGLLQGS